MGATKKTKGAGLSRENVYDYTEHWRWLFTVGGYGSSRSAVYTLYKLVSLVFLVFATFLTLYSTIRFSSKKDLMVDAMHAHLGTIYAVGALLIGIFCYRSLEQARQTLVSGFFHYQGEELDPEGQKIADEALARVRRGIRIANMIPITAFWNSFAYGLTQVFVISEEEYEDVVNDCNPYMPHCIYLPFSTRSNSGFIAGFIFTALMSVYLYGIAIIQLQIYVCLTLQLTIQLELLNHSIRTLPERADRMYAHYFGKIPSGGRPYDQPEYQACLYRCLRSNIQHHQTLRKFRDDIYIFTGAVVLLLMIIAAVIFGSKLYLLLKGPAINKFIAYTTTFAMEQSFGLCICYYGENVLQESSKLFESLYSFQWPDCNKGFNKVVNIFMVYTREPMTIKMYIFDIKACIEFYGDMMIGAYKLSNLLSQSDSKLNL